MSEEMTAARIRIECIPTATEAERPIRLILATVRHGPVEDEPQLPHDTGAAIPAQPLAA